MSQTSEMMNCKEYKEALTADPTFEGGAEHVAACADCQAYRTQMLELNDRIGRALGIEVPDLTMPELPDLDTNKVVSLSNRRLLTKPVWFALAATVLLAVTIGVRLSEFGVSYGSLEEQVLAHVDHEPLSLFPSDTAVSDESLALAVPANIATMNHNAGLITYARSCTINGRNVPHLVIQGEYGPITILLMPDESIAEAKTLEGENIRGVILPVGNGSIAIIGGREERLDRVRKNVLDSIMWST